MFSSVVVNMFKAVVCIECRAVSDTVSAYRAVNTLHIKIKILFTNKCTLLLNI